MNDFNERAIRVIKRLSIKPTEKAPVLVKTGGSTASIVDSWVLERREKRLAEVVFSTNKILGWKSS